MKIKIQHILFLLMFNCSYMVCMGQENIYWGNDCIRKKVFNFLVEIKLLNKIEDMDGRMLIFEIVNKTDLNNDNNSIYAFKATTSHTPFFFLLKEDCNYKILNGYNVTETYEEIIAFLKEIHFDDNEVIIYMERVSSILKENLVNHYPSNDFPITGWVKCN